MISIEIGEVSFMIDLASEIDEEVVPEASGAYMQILQSPNYLLD